MPEKPADVISEILSSDVPILVRHDITMYAIAVIRLNLNLPSKILDLPLPFHYSFRCSSPYSSPAIRDTPSACWQVIYETHLVYSPCSRSTGPHFH